MLGLALGAAIASTGTTGAYAQVPRNISYQGQLMENNQAATGAYTITINYYTAGGTAPIYTETFSNVTVQNGIFNVILGSNGGFPATMDFNEQYFIGVQVNGGGELTPRTAMLASPYALNANAINGFSVSDVPTAGQLLVLDANGRVPNSALPAGPTFVAGNNIAIQQDTLTNTFTFSSTGGNAGGITGVTVGNGLVGGGTSGEVQINLAPNGITTDMIAPGAITGTRLSPTLAGDGLFQDVLGNLNVGVDGTSIIVGTDDRLSIGTIGTGNIDSTIQRRITGTATPGTFITGVNQNGTITTATVTTDSSLTRTLNGNNVSLALNPAFTNTFTAPQNFGVIKATAVNTQTLNADMITTDDLNANGNIMFGDGLTNGNVTFNTGTGVISLSGATLQDVGDPVNGTDAVTLDYLTNQMTTQMFGGDITGTFDSLQINTANAGLGDRLIQGINAGSTTINDLMLADNLTINGGTIDNTVIGATTPAAATFTDLTVQNDLTVNGSVTFGDGSTANNFTFNTAGGVIDFGGAALTNLGAPVNGGDAVTLDFLDNQMTNQMFGGDVTGTFDNLQLNTTNPGVGDRLISGINSGTTTINDLMLTDALTVNGGTIDNTPIGATTASSGMFTTLSSSGQTQLATGTGDVVIGTSSPLSTGAILEIERAEAGDLLARLFNTGAGGAELRIIGGENAMSTLAFTDAQQYVSSINSDADVGLTFNVRDVTDPNSEAGLDAATAMTIERDGDVVINEDLTVGGTLTVANGTFTGSTFGISGGDITATATPTGATSNRFADTYTVTGGPLATVTIPNSLVTTNSTVIVTFEDNSGGTIPTYTVQTDANGSFSVVFSGANAENGDEIHYMIINH
jgi:hypothetical protein